MAKRQTRRTVSIARPSYDRLVAYAAANRVAASALTEYALEQLLAGPLDLEAFRAWRSRRDAESSERQWANWSSAMAAVAAHHVMEDPVITDEERAKWHDVIQRRMRGRVRVPSARSAP